MKNKNFFKINSFSFLLINKKLFTAIIIILLNIIIYSFGQTTSTLIKSNETTTTPFKPIIYTRLRFDQNYLPVFRNWHNKLPIDEELDKKYITFNDTITTSINDNNNNNIKKNVLVTYEYYENYNVNQNSLTLDDLILESLDQVYKTHLIQGDIYNYDKSNDRLISSDPNIVSNERCNRELEYLLRKLKTYELIQNNNLKLPIEPEVAGLFDSFSPNEPSLLMGNFHWIGAWRECKRRVIFDPNPNPNPDPANSYNEASISGNSNNNDSLINNHNHKPIRFSGRHCLAALRSSKWEKLIDIRSKELEDKLYFKYPEQKFDYKRFFRIQVGFCLPQSCDSSLIFKRKSDIHRLATSRLSYPIKGYDLVDLFCLPDETSELRQISSSGCLLIIFLLVWTLICLMATCLDSIGYTKNLDNRSSLYRLIGVFSIFENYYRLMSRLLMAPEANRLNQDTSTTTTTPTIAIETKQQQQQQHGPRLRELFFLDFFKFYAMLFVISGHVVTVLWQHGKYSPDQDQFGHGFLFHIMAPSAVFYVDWFFLMSGLILSFSMFLSKKIESNTLAQWLYSIFHRYWRLAPLYLLMFWFTKSLFKYTGSGPLWDYGTSNMTLRGICERESWMWPIFMISNWHPLHEECVLTSWYPSNDIQFFIFTPPILICLSKYPIQAWYGSLVALLAGLAARFNRYMTDPRAKHLDLIHVKPDCYMRNSWDMHPTYLYPHYRFQSYLIGLLTGHYIYMVLSGHWKSPIYQFKGKLDKKGKLLRALIFWLGMLIVIPMTFSTLFFIHAPKYVEKNAKLFASMAYSMHHTIMAIGMSMIIIAIIFGQSKPMKLFCAHPIWTTLARLNYVVLLIQSEVIYWFAQNDDWMIYPNLMNAVRFWLAMVVICYTIAIPLTIMIELPLAQLEQQFVAPLFFSFKNNNNRNIDKLRDNKQQTSDNLLLSNKTEQQLESVSSSDSNVDQEEEQQEEE